MKKNKKIVIGAIAVLLAVGYFASNTETVEEPKLGVASVIYQRNIQPITDSLYDLGTNLVRWKNVFFDNATTTSMTIEGLVSCDTIDTDASGNLSCGTDDGAGGGEANTASSLGTGLNLYDSKSGSDLRFNTLSAGTNVTFSTSTQDNTIVISSTSSGEANTASNVGTGVGVFKQKAGVDLEFKTLTSSSTDLFTFTSNTNEVTLDSTQLINNSSTGLVSGGELSTTTSTTFGFTAGSAVFVNNYTDVNNPTYERVTWNASSSIAIIALGTELVHTITMDKDGVIYQNTEGNTTQEDLRDRVLLGTLLTADNTTITSITDIVANVRTDIAAQLSDFMRVFGNINSGGNTYSAASTDLTIKKTAGTTFAQGRNWRTNAKDPHNLTDAAENPITWLGTYQDGAGDFTFTVGNTALDVTKYDDGSGTLATVTNNKWQNFRITFFSDKNPITVIAYGQTLYNSQSEAVSAQDKEQKLEDESVSSGSFRGWVTVRGAATDLSDTGDALFTTFDLLTGGGGGSSPTGSLQDAYDNSAEPEILTNSTRIAMTLRRGSASDIDSVFEVQNNAGTVTGAWSGDGTATTTALTISGLTSALVLTNALGQTAEYAGVTCTNQFVRALSALGAGTCASVDLTMDITGILAVANGGTGVSSFTQYEILYAPTTTSLGGIGLGASGEVLTSNGAGAVATWQASAGGGGGAGTVSTSTNETANNIPYWTSTSATPALLGSDIDFTFDGTSVGIGSSTPFAKLGITNSGTGNTLLIEDTASPDSTPFVIDASGNVGIGLIAPTQALDVVGNINMTTGLYEGGNLVFSTSKTAIGLLAGVLAGDSVTSAIRFTIIGYEAGEALTTADRSTLIGYRAGFKITNGFSNTIVGAEALDALTTGDENSAFGVGALGGGLNNGSRNTVFGNRGFEQVSSGFRNTGIGFQPGNGITTGSYNTAIGYLAGFSSDLSNNLNLVNFIYGTDVGAGGTVPDASGKIGIGTSTPATIFDIFSTATTSPRFDSNSATQGACLILKDWDGGGYTYGVALNGTLTWSTTDCR